jgi:hypothetical protein
MTYAKSISRGFLLPTNENPINRLEIISLVLQVRKLRKETERTQTAAIALHQMVHGPGGFVPGDIY